MDKKIRELFDNEEWKYLEHEDRRLCSTVKDWTQIMHHITSEKEEIYEYTDD